MSVRTAVAVRPAAAPSLMNHAVAPPASGPSRQFRFSLSLSPTVSSPLVAPLERSDTVLGVALGGTAYLYGATSKRDEKEGTMLYAVKQVLEAAKAQASIPSVDKIAERAETEQGTVVDLVATRSGLVWTTMLTATADGNSVAITPIVAGEWKL